MKKDIIDLIESEIDHYTPYREITDSKEAQEVRKVLGRILVEVRRR